MTTTEPEHRTPRHTLSEVPIRRLTAEEIEAGRNHPVGTPEERAEKVRAILAAGTFSAPNEPAQRWWVR
ncbi:hypothetical protein ACIPJ2_16645 [Curtobacterium sp. NPDC090217]|uniref:hypothetical protein n=1 Tax=Curtobacterium sp. NPDC090217 TaxID=3363970 RepID=UPI003803F0E4